MIRVAVLVSGGGTNLQAMLDAAAAGQLRSGVISLVVASRADAYALTRAAGAGIETAVVPRGDFDSAEAWEAALLRVLESRGVELIVLAGFLSILSGDFVARYPGRILNVHPALIPAFSGQGFYGLRVHEAALARGVKVTGATVHVVNHIPDGGEILAQKTVPVRRGDTAQTLQRRVMEQAEWVLLPRVVEQVCRRLKRGRQP